MLAVFAAVLTAVAHLLVAWSALAFCDAAFCGSALGGFRALRPLTRLPHARPRPYA